MDTNGFIRIDFKRVGELLRCTIEDNGIGRKEAQRRKEASVHQRKSVALGIIQTRLDFFRDESPFKEIDLHVKDLEGENVTGTKVSILLPTK